ncbi:hypothetical protein [Hydrogenimonas thermophila]|uniref:Uncharacterized protein n=1 Tax=Hydrogenimonas thermophila TaxID=223786 RepID=A0A1I5M6L0_9BACT|nr:hypothetical protein [Hydrogenimonas thermophila]SFP04967.1 hypothetical protein SAMN05216234_10526 [Hydrogenimonas thermophila]
MKKILFLLIAGIMALGFSGCSSAMSQIASAKTPPKIYVHSKTPEKFKGIKPYQAVWNGLAPAVVKYDQIMQCDFTPEALVVLRDKGFQIVSDPNEADYRLDVEVLACGFYTTTDTSYDSISILYRQRKEVPLKEKPLYKDLIAAAHNKDVPYAKYFAMVVDALEINPDEGMQLFHRYGMLKYKVSKYLDHPWHRIATNGAQYEILKTKGYLYPNKYDGMPEEDKKFVKKWLKTSVESDEMGKYAILSDVVGLSITNFGGTLSNIGYSGAGRATAALGVATMLFSKRPGSSANRFTITDMKTGKKVYVDRNYLLKGQFGWKKVIGKDDLDWVEKHLDKVFNKL